MKKPDLVGFRITHRAMRGDVRRLATVTAELAEGRQRASAARLAALAGFVSRLCAGIHHHHTMEDEVLWPVLVRCASAEVDLSDLTDDHRELDPLLDEITAAAARIGADRAALTPLAVALARLADLLDEHIAEEEKTIFPVIEAYVSGEEWAKVEAAVRKGADLRFDLPRIGQYALPEELAALRKAAGPVLSLLLALVRRGHERRQRLIFESA
ncbi:hemerythrin domain-containing protein [Nonomuraea sp. NPDC050328]|uniref:hemerythrin domain-containing protein n=1 Tax=Nonomuraea sp. NPDC050328 TaxID=3364361 RepID=UPI0037895EF7